MKADPRTKLLIIALMTTLSVFALDIIYLSAILIFTLAFCLIFKADFIRIIKRIRYLIFMIFILAVIQSLTVKGGIVLLRISKLDILTLRGVTFSIEFFLRMSILISASMIATTSKSNEFIDGLIKLKLPYEFAFMASTAIRFIPLLKDEFSNRLTVVSLRGIEVKKLKFPKKLKLYSYIITPAIIGGMFKSKELATAMTARAFRAYKKRTMLRQLKLRSIDYLIMCLTVGFTAVFIYATIAVGGIL